jgi:hypothetical protein
VNAVRIHAPQIGRDQRSRHELRMFLAYSGRYQSPCRPRGESFSSYDWQGCTTGPLSSSAISAAMRRASST